jgi:hypothetical protein
LTLICYENVHHLPKQCDSYDDNRQNDLNDLRYYLHATDRWTAIHFDRNCSNFYLPHSWDRQFSYCGMRYLCFHNGDGHHP